VKFVDLVRQLSTSTGTGPFRPSVVQPGYDTFESALDVGDEFYYSIIAITGGLKEVGIGTWRNDGQFDRAPIGTLVNFPSGQKTVAITVAAEWYQAVDDFIAAGGGTPAWGGITGSLGAQTDLAAALAAKADDTDISAINTALGLKANSSDLTALALIVAGKVDLSGLSELTDDRVAALLQQGSNVTLVYDDASNTLTINSTGTGGGGGGTNRFDFSVAGNSQYLALEVL
jgi:hypothetical protein